MECNIFGNRLSWKSVFHLFRLFHLTVRICSNGVLLLVNLIIINGESGLIVLAPLSAPQSMYTFTVSDDVTKHYH